MGVGREPRARRATCRSTRYSPRPRRRAWTARTWRSSAASPIAIRTGTSGSNYLDVQDNFNAEAGFVQRTGIRTTKALLQPDAAARQGQRSSCSSRCTCSPTPPISRTGWSTGTHHLMLGTTLRDDSFINVIYQKNLDVLDVPFRIRPDVTIPVGSYKMRRVDVHLQHQPGPPLLRARDGPSRWSSTAARAADADRRGRRPRDAASCRASCSTTATTSNMPWGDFLVEPVDRCASTTRSRRA